MSAQLALTQVTATNPVTEPPRADIVLARGQSKRVRCTVLDSSGVAVNLLNKTLVYAWARRPGSTPTQVECEPIDEDNGVADLIFTAAATETADVAVYAARFWLVDTTNETQEPVSATSRLTLTEGVADLDGTIAAPPAVGGGVTATNSGTATFTTSTTALVTYTTALAEAVIPRLGLPYISAGGGAYVWISAYSTTGFTLTASATISGLVPYVVTGEAA